MIPTMPADRKQVEDAVERLRGDVSWGRRMKVDGVELTPVYITDLDALLTDYAALLARAEAAEAALREANLRLSDYREDRRMDWRGNQCTGGIPQDLPMPEYRFQTPDYGTGSSAAHQQPAPVKAGETSHD